MKDQSHLVGLHVGWVAFEQFRLAGRLFQSVVNRVLSMAHRASLSSPRRFLSRWRCSIGLVSSTAVLANALTFSTMMSKKERYTRNFIVLPEFPIDPRAPNEAFGSFRRVRFQLPSPNTAPPSALPRWIALLPFNDHHPFAQRVRQGRVRRSGLRITAITLRRFNWRTGLCIREINTNFVGEFVTRFLPETVRSISGYCGLRCRRLSKTTI